MSLLIAESPLVVLPTLADRVGLAESVFLQQIHFLCVHSKNIRDGERWVYNTYGDWVEQYPFLKNEPKVQRIVSSLEKMGVLITTDKYNSLKIDKRKWYRVNYDSDVLKVLQDSKMNDEDSKMNDEDSKMNDEDSKMNEQYTENYNKEFQQRKKDSVVADENSIADEEQNQSLQTETEITEDQSSVVAKATTLNATKSLSEDKKRFEAVAKIYNCVFADCHGVGKVSLDTIPNPKTGKPEYTKVNQRRLKLIPYAWEIAKIRIEAWKDSDGLIDGEVVSSKHVLQWFENYFAECHADGFITGTTERQSHKTWKPDFDYMLKAETLEKRVLEK